MKSVATILYVEDDPLLRCANITYLSNLGFHTLEAENGLKAWEIFQQKSPDLVLTDLRMPVMDGMELLAKITVESPGTPVIILSGVGTMDDVIEAMRLGACDYLTKPVLEMSYLLHAIKKALLRSKILHDSLNYQQLLEQTFGEKTKKLEDELQGRKKIEKLVLNAKQELERTIDAMPEMIALLDLEQRIVRVNRPMATAMGLTPAEAIGIKCYSCMHSKKCPPDQCPHLQMLQDKQPHTVEIYEELFNCDLEVIVIPRLGPDGITLIGSIHIARDITARKKAEQEQKKLQSQMLHNQKLESVGQLASGIAHEIKAPLEHVGTNIEFLDEAIHDVRSLIDRLPILLKAKEENALTPQLFQDVRQAMHDIDWAYLSSAVSIAVQQSQDTVKRISSIVQEIEDFSQPAGKEMVLTNINSLVLTSIHVTTNEWEDVAEIETDLDANLPSIYCLSDELGQVILNMLMNAIHAISDKLGADPAGQTGTIGISTKHDGEWVELRISDTGIGIPEEIRQRIFDPFFTTKEVGKGTGQGLAIVHDVVVGKHQGNISLVSEVGVGTSFIIRLPQKRANAADGAACAPA